jgi:hypothetical protein
MRALVLVLVVSSTASAETLDLKKTLERMKPCNAETLAMLGPIEKFESIGKRPTTELVHVIGKKARGYALFNRDGANGCELVPVVGKPLSYAKGNFGHGAVAAYALAAPNCGEMCSTVVSLKSKDDALLDVFVSSELCENGLTMKKQAVFAGRDSIVLGCYGSGGADVGRSDHLLDAGSGALVEMLAVNAGTGWIQTNDDGSAPRCSLKIPGGLAVATTGAKPELAVTEPTTPELAEAAKVDYQSGGCDITVQTRRMVFDGKKFVAKGKPKIFTKKKFCECQK